MPEETDIIISELTNAPQIDDTAVFPLTQDNGGSPATFKASMSEIAGKVAEGTTFVNLTTTAKDLVGAINEAASTGGSVDITTEIDTPAPIMTFNDGGNNIPLKSLVTEIVPIQEGSGTPSPSNVRTISGHSNCVVTVSDGDSISRTTTISLGSTVYGGSLECVNGALTISKIYWEFDGSADESWNKVSGTGKFYIVVYDVVKTYNDGKISNIYPFSGTATSSAGVTVDKSFYTQRDENTPVYNRVWIYNSDYENYSVEQFKEVLSGQPLQIVANLIEAEQIHITISGTNIPTLSGLNNIYADCGDIQSLEYFNENGNDIDSLVDLEVRLSGRIRTKTYTGDGSVPLVVTFDEVPTMILNIFGPGQGSQVIAFPFVYGLTSFGGVYVTPNPWTPPTQAGGNHLLYKVAYSNGGKTMTVRASANDAGAHFNQSGDTYTIYYLV